MTLIFLCSIIGFSALGQANDSLPNSGEIRSAEVLIEKERKIVLPTASRLFQTTEIKELSKEPPPVSFSINAPQIALPKYVPTFRTLSLEKGKKDKTYANEAILGFGNYISPLLSFTHLQEKNEWTFGANLFHESFLEGPVRNQESGSSLTQLGMRIAWKSENTRFSFAPQFNRTGYYFYGLSDEAFANPTEQTLTDRIRTQDFQLKAVLSGKGISDKLRYRIAPKVSFVSSAEIGKSAFANESNFDIDAGADFSVDKKNRVGLDFRGLTSSYESGTSLKRSVFSFEPWYRTKINTIDFKIGLQANAISDTDTATQTQVGAVMELRVPFGGSWSITGGIDNRIRFNRLLDLYPQNPFVEDSLSLRTSVEKVPFYGVLKGAILPNLEVEAGVEIRDIENAIYFEPSLIDSSRFTMDYDTAELNVFKYHVGLNYHVNESFELKAGFSYFDYSPGSEVEAWNRPTSVFDLSGVKRFDKWLLTTRLKVVNGIIAPSPVDFQPVDLKGFADLSLKVDYRINEQSAVFLQGENLFNQSYAYFLNYPTRRIAIKAGFRYRF
ncbi:MAG: hypothetical protein R8G66_03720 [Cytophagales bacterium]|nr:hypothetical protein [Cytophagales bacterium]